MLYNCPNCLLTLNLGFQNLPLEFQIFTVHGCHIRIISDEATIMHGGLTKCVNGPITAAYVGWCTISGLLIVFITNSFKRSAIQDHIIPSPSLVVITSCSVQFSIVKNVKSIFNVLISFWISTVSFSIYSSIIAIIWFINSAMELSICEVKFI